MKLPSLPNWLTYLFGIISIIITSIAFYVVKQNQNGTELQKQVNILQDSIFLLNNYIDESDGIIESLNRKIENCKGNLVNGSELSSLNKCENIAECPIVERLKEEIRLVEEKIEVLIQDNLFENDKDLEIVVLNKCNGTVPLTAPPNEIVKALENFGLSNHITYAFGQDSNSFLSAGYNFHEYCNLSLDERKKIAMKAMKIANADIIFF